MALKVLNIVFNDFTRDSRVLKESRSIVNGGHQVTVLCMHNPGLAIVEYKKGFRVERMQIISRRLKSIAIFRPLMYVETAFKILQRSRNYDVLHVNDFEPLPIALLAKVYTLGRIKIVYDAHELESEKVGMSGLMKKGVRSIERVAKPMLSGFITISNSVARIYAEKAGYMEPTILFNCPPYQAADKKSSVLRTEFGIPPSAIIYIYQGLLAKGRGLEFLLEGFEQHADANHVLVVMGFGVMEMDAREYAGRCANIFFKPGVPFDQLLEVTTSADVGISLLTKTCLNHEYTMPNKFFEYMIAGIPAIVSPVHEMKWFVESHQVGEVLSENDADAVVSMLNNMSPEKIKDYASRTPALADEYNWERQESKLQSLYEQLDS